MAEPTGTATAGDGARNSVGHNGRQPEVTGGRTRAVGVPEPARDVARRTQRWLGGVRLATAGWAIVMVLTYPDYPAQGGATIELAALTLVLAYLVGVSALWIRLEVTDFRLSPRFQALIGFALDAVTAGGITFLYAFDRTSSVWIVMFLLGTEGAMRFRVRGLVALLALITGVYTAGVLWAAAVYGTDVDLRSIVFRMTVVGVVTALVALISEELHGQRRNAEQALAELQRGERWRSRLVAALGHDVRGPLATIQMQAQLLAGDRVPPERREQLLGGIARQAAGLQRLAEDLLEMARAAEVALELHREPVELGQLVTGVVRELDADVEVHVPDGLVVEVDPRRMEQVLVNLVTNALRHGAPPLEVRATDAGDHVLVDVRDHGTGVPPEIADGIFEAFSRRSGDQGSVGLGLWIVRELVQAHGGAVSLLDGPPTTFRVALPRAPADRPATAGPGLALGH